MKNFIICSAVVILLATCPSCSAQSPHPSTTIPASSDVVSASKPSKPFVIDKDAAIVYNDCSLLPIARLLSEYIPLPVIEATDNVKARCIIQLNIVPSSIVGDAEGYRFETNVANGQRLLSISASSYAGVFNGVQTLLQLLPPKVYARQLSLPATLSIGEMYLFTDAPTYAYRGFLLDVARTWISADRVKRIIDLLAYHKINKLHFHLTDDEGWRIEIKSHPELATVGGFRGGDSPVPARYAKFDEKWGGYYTQEELRDIVAYATVRNIEIIPEIDMPGHSKALGEIHPEILCNSAHDLTRTNGIDIRNVWCAAKESNYALIDDIIREVADIFPSEYIHIGGDEVEMKYWHECPDCQRLKRAKGLRDERQIEDYFIARVTEILARYGRRPAVWNEATDGGLLPTSTLVYGWQGKRQCKSALDKGYRTIIMPGDYFYFDMKQSAHEAGHTWAAIFDASKVVGFDLASWQLSSEQEGRIAGIEASFFSEIFVAHSPETDDYIDYMLFPRICSLAEVAWSGTKKRTWNTLYDALRTAHYDRMSNMGIAFRLQSPKVDYANGRLSATTDDNSTLYVIDKQKGVESKYTEPIVCSDPTDYRFISRRGTGRSAEVGSKECYQWMKPAVTVTSSMPCSKRNPIENAAMYDNHIARTTRAAHDGDWILYTFAEPLKCRSITAHMGHLHLARCLLLAGEVEASYDGSSFETVASLVDGEATFSPKAPVMAVRIRATGNSDAEDNVVITSLRIR